MLLFDPLARHGRGLIERGSLIAMDVIFQRLDLVMPDHAFARLHKRAAAVASTRMR